jgi:diguanylate cyclase (GGDEF)-like protein
MELLGYDMILKLKGRFFDLLNPESEYFGYEYIREQLVLTLKELTNSEEVTLFNIRECNKRVFVEASSNPCLKSQSTSTNITSVELDKQIKLKPTQKSILIGDLSYDIVAPLMYKQLFLGYLAIKSIKCSLSDEILQTLYMECSTLIAKSQHFEQILQEEKRYKQLFRVTEKFHSSMNMELVLGEIINTLKEVYPTFTYYLLLSHDHNSYGELPIKDLEYDSENDAAMECYVTGTVKMEERSEEERSVLYAPLKGKQGVYGVLQVTAPDALEFPNNEVNFISLLANTAGGAIENAQLYEQSKRLISDLQLINETSHRLNSNLRLTETMDYMVKQIIKSFNAQEAGFILYNTDFTKAVVQEGSTDFFYTAEADSYINYFMEKIQTDKDAIFIGDLSLPGKDLSQERYKSVMAVPMVQSDSLRGFALVMHKEPYHFSFETFKLFLSLIHHSTLAFTNTMLREELEKMVVTDHLTKLYSRSYLDEKIEQSMNEDAEGTFILIDIDNFKIVNDTYGHQVGDEVLIQVAEIVQSNIRGTDIGARWGGEELAIYLPRIPLSTGAQIAERLCKRVREESKPSITISCGLSHWEKEHIDCYNTLFKRADKALYIAKGTGKDKVVIFNEDSEQETE